MGHPPVCLYIISAIVNLQLAQPKKKDALLICTTRDKREISSIPHVCDLGLMYIYIYIHTIFIAYIEGLCRA